MRGLKHEDERYAKKQTTTTTKIPSFAIKSRPPTIISHLVASTENTVDLNSTRGQSLMALAVPSTLSRKKGGCGDDPQWPTILCVNWEIVAWSGVNAMKGCESMEYEWFWFLAKEGSRFPILGTTSSIKATYHNWCDFDHINKSNDVMKNWLLST